MRNFVLRDFGGGVIALIGGSTAIALVSNGGFGRRTKRSQLEAIALHLAITPVTPTRRRTILGERRRSLTVFISESKPAQELGRGADGS
jgi:hypothetical protein